MIPEVFNIIINIDQNLPLIIQEYGLLTYFILFTIIFFETGFVVTPYLPGDSLLFVAGVCAASGLLDIWWLLAAFILGAIVGDTANYWIGSYCGSNLFKSRFCRIFKDEHFNRAKRFFEQYGGKTIFLARFLPMVRTFAPFLAGVGCMHYRRFVVYNITGAIVWSVSIVLLGFYAGTVPVVKTNLNVLVYFVVLLTVGTVIFIVYKLFKTLRRPEGGE